MNGVPSYQNTPTEDHKLNEIILTKIGKLKFSLDFAHEKKSTDVY